MKKIIITTILSLFLSPYVMAYTNLPQNKALIRALNKQTGRTKDIEIEVNKSQIFENIKIDINACYTRPEDETPENSAFIVITESTTSYKEEVDFVKKGNLIFSGWMFSSSPSLVAMEHPNYDIWLLECKDDPNLQKIELPIDPSSIKTNN